MTQKAIIFDIDGTLADCSHRKHFVSGKSKDWKAFFEAMPGDAPTPVTRLANIVSDWWGMARDVGYPEQALAVFVFSGRPEDYRLQTVEWLDEHARNLLQNAVELCMRKSGDYRPDTVVKKEMLDSVKARGYEPVIVVDDRPSVIEMWKSEGLQVLEVDSGEWEDSGPTVTPGNLAILVGPSGAGKSTFAKAGYPASWVLSTDQFRHELGSMRDQSKNAQVYRALHAMVKARIENGLHTVVDATNLHARDRRAIRDVVPQNTKITYVVIDRPLAEKHKSAGWRDEVVINGVKLVDKHHETFQSGLKHILAGDNDPRVTVVDKRIL